MRSRWKKIRHRLEWLCLELLSRLLPRMPRRLVVLLAKGVGSVAYRFDKRGRRIALANIAAVFGDRFTSQEREAIAWASYRDFSRTMLDLFWSPALNSKNFRRYLKIENIEVLHKLRARGESVILMCLHHGNFEWAGLASGFEGFPATIVTEEFKNSQISEFFKRCREVSGHRIITQKSSMIRLLKHVKKGGISGMLVDLNCKPSEAATVIDTFGMVMCATYMHAVLAQRGGARMVPIEGRSQDDGTCRVIFHEPLDVPAGLSHQQFTQRCWDYFTPLIQNDPQHWMWAYRHWRFKPKDAAGPYPFYASADVAFEQLFKKVTAETAA